MEFLADLGKEDVELKKRRGKKFVVIDPEAAGGITVVVIGRTTRPRVRE